MSSPSVEIRFRGDARSGVAAAHEMKSALHDTGQEAEKTKHHFGALAAGLASKAFLGATLAVGALGTAVGVAGFKFDAMREQAQIAFTTMLGSGEKAKKFLDELEAFAAKTPFEFPQLVATAQQLKAMGFEAKEVIPMLTSIGNAVSAMGGSPEMLSRVTRALGQMQAKGKVSAEEMLQLTEAGIPAWQYLADKIGVTVPAAMKLSQQGAIDATTAIHAVTAGMDRDFGGMMEKQSHTFQGLLSTIKDTFGIISGKIMKPFFEWAVKGMQGLVDLFGTKAFKRATDGIASFVEEAGKKIGSFIKDVSGWVINLGKRLVGAFQDAWPTIQNVFGRVREIAGQVFETVGKVAVTAWNGIQQAGAAAWPYVQKTFTLIEEQGRKAFSTVADVAKSAFEGMKPHMEALGGVLGEVGAAMATKWIEEWSVVRVEVLKNFAAVGQAVAGLGPQLDVLFRIAGDVFSAWISAVAELSTVLFKVGSEILRGILVPAFSAVLQAIVPVAIAIDWVAKKIGGWKLVIEGIIIAWTAWKVAMLAQQAIVVAAFIAGNAKIVISNAIAALEVSTAWKAALISTGWGALAVAAGLAAAYIITHWGQVKAFFSHFTVNMTNLWNATVAALKAGAKSLPLYFKGQFELMAAVSLIPLILLAKGAAKALGWIPGIGDKVKAAAGAITGWVKDLGIQGAKDIAAAGGNMGKAFSDELNLNLETGLATAATQVTNWGIRNQAQPGSPGAAVGVPSGSRANAPSTVKALTATAVKYGPGSGIKYPTVGYGNATPTTGFDCSGYIQWIYGKAGIAIPRDTHGQWPDPNAIKVPKGQEQAGDAVYFGKGGSPGHTGYYLGGGWFIEYFSHGKYPKTSKLSDRSDYMGARRWIKIVEGAGTGGGGAGKDKGTPTGASGGAGAGAGAGADVATPVVTSVKAPTSVRTVVKDASDAAVATVRRAAVKVSDSLKDIANPKTRAAFATQLKAITHDLLEKGLSVEDLAKLKDRIDKVKGHMKDVTDAQKKALAVMKAHAKAAAALLKENAKAAASALADLKKAWASMQQGFMSAANLTLQDVGTGVAKSLRAAGVIIAGSVTSGEYRKAWETFARVQTELSKKALKAADIEALRKQGEEAAAIIADYGDQLVQSVNGNRAKLNSAWDRFTGLALQAFDKAHAKMRDALQAALTFDGITVKLGVGDLTPSEGELGKVQDAISAIDDAAEVQRLRDDVAAAGTLAERQRALLALTSHYLSAKAALEREAADKALNEKQGAFDEQTDADRGQFEGELQDIRDRMADGTYSYRKGLDATRALFAKYQVPFEQQSDALGKALSSALVAAFEGIKTAMSDLGTSISALVAFLEGQAARAVQLAQKVSAASGTGVAVAGLPGPGVVPSGGPNDLVYGKQYVSSRQLPGGTMYYFADGTSKYVTVGSFAQGGVIGGEPGGLISGSYTPSDSLVANVSRGEMILNPQQQANLWSLAKYGSGGGSQTTIVNVYPQGSVIAERDLGRTIRESLAPIMRANGRTPI